MVLAGLDSVLVSLLLSEDLDSVDLDSAGLDSPDLDSVLVLDESPSESLFGEEDPPLA